MVQSLETQNIRHVACLPTSSKPIVSYDANCWGSTTGAARVHLQKSWNEVASFRWNGWRGKAVFQAADRWVTRARVADRHAPSFHPIRSGV